MAAGHTPAHVVHVGAVGMSPPVSGAGEDEHELAHHRMARQADERQRHEHHKGEQPAHMLADTSRRRRGAAGWTDRLPRQRPADAREPIAMYLG